MFSSGRRKLKLSMLEWSAEQVTEITMEEVELEFTPNCDEHRQISRATRPTTLSPTRGRTRGKLGDDCRNGMRKLFRTIIHFSWTMLSHSTSRWYRAMGILRCSPRGKGGGIPWTMGSNSLVWAHWYLRNSRNIQCATPIAFEHLKRLWRRSLA